MGAAVVPRNRRVYKIRDSKLLTEPERAGLFDRIAGWCVTWAVGHATQEECDELGMSEAQRLRPVEPSTGSGHSPDKVLLDGRWDFVGGKRGGSSRVTPRACRSPPRSWPRSPETASCRAWPQNHPSYDFEAQQGLPVPPPTALKWLGPTAIHRRSWVFMDHIPWSGIPRLRPVDPQQSLFEAE